MRRLIVMASSAATVVALGAFLFAPRARSTSSDSTSSEVARSGCCSWHGGVCGCSGGRAVCCDGTLSPSCGCD